MVAVKRPGWGSRLSEGQQKQYKQAKQAEHEAVGNTRKADKHRDFMGDTGDQNYMKAVKHEMSSADHAEAFRNKHKPKGE